MDDSGDLRSISAGARHLHWPGASVKVSRKWNGAFPLAEHRRRIVQARCIRILFAVNCLHRQCSSWHAGCIRKLRQPKNSYEQRIRIHLCTSGSLRRKRPRRSRNDRLRGFHLKRDLLDLGICNPTSCQNSGGRVGTLRCLRDAKRSNGRVELIETKF